MAFLFFVLPLFMILIAIVSCRDKSRENCAYMINVDWLADSDKFNLITRWGVK